MDKHIDETLDRFEEDQKLARTSKASELSDSFKKYGNQAKEDIDLLENELAPTLEGLAEKLKQRGHKMTISRSWSTNTTPRTISFEFRPDSAGADTMKRLEMRFHLSTSGNEDKVLAYITPWDGKETHVPEKFTRTGFNGQQIKKIAWEAIEQVLMSTKDLG